MMENVLEALDSEPFGERWKIWCHPKTLRELYVELREENTMPPTPEQRFNRDFSVDRHLPEDEFFTLPGDIMDLTAEFEYLEHPPGAFVSQLIDTQGITQHDEDVETVFSTQLYYDVDAIEYRFDHDTIATASIPALADLIKKHVPDDHPAVAPDMVEWVSDKELLEVDAGVEIDGSYYWVWRENYSNQTLLKPVLFHYTVSDWELADGSDDVRAFHVDCARRQFLELAIKHINTTDTAKLKGYREEKLSTHEIDVGEKVVEYGDLSMMP